MIFSLKYGVQYRLGLDGVLLYLDLPEKLELPERPPKYWKDQSIIGEISDNFY